MLYHEPLPHLHFSLNPTWVRAPDFGQEGDQWIDFYRLGEAAFALGGIAGVNICQAGGPAMCFETNDATGTGVYTRSLQSGLVEFAQTATPLPAALPLFATGLGALGLLGWRRKRKAAALAA
jgi:hypothetical protein